MSKINDLRTNTKYQFDFIDILTEFIPDKKTKYLETFIRILFNQDKEDFIGLSKNGNIIDVDKYKRYLSTNFDIPFENLNKYSDFTITMIYSFVDCIFGLDNMKEFSAFCEFTEKNLTKNTDLTQYHDISQIIDENNYVLEKLEEKELEKQIRKIHEDDAWLVLRPLTFEASKKYGANTTWCTTSDKYLHQFKNYTENGILIYIINKRTNYKVAVSFYNKETIFWNAQDKPINPIDTNVPPEIIFMYVHPEIKTGITNVKVLEKLKKNKTNEDINNEFKSLLKGRSSEQHDFKKILKSVFENTNYTYTDLNDTSTNPDNFINILKEKFGL